MIPYLVAWELGRRQLFEIAVWEKTIQLWQEVQENYFGYSEFDILIRHSSKMLGRLLTLLKRPSNYFKGVCFISWTGPKFPERQACLRQLYVSPWSSKWEESIPLFWSWSRCAESACTDSQESTANIWEKLNQLLSHPCTWLGWEYLPLEFGKLYESRLLFFRKPGYQYITVRPRVTNSDALWGRE